MAEALHGLTSAWARFLCRGKRPTVIPHGRLTFLHDCGNVSPENGKGPGLAVPPESGAPQWGGTLHR